jgi:hypothetical protein
MHPDRPAAEDAAGGSGARAVGTLRSCGTSALKELPPPEPPEDVGDERDTDPGLLVDRVRPLFG